MRESIKLYAEKYRALTTPGREDTLLAHLLALLPPRQESQPLVADLGCGVGHIAQALSAQGYRVCAIDSSPEMLAEARRLYPGLTFVEGDIRYSVPPIHADAVVCLGEVINYLGSTSEMRLALHNIRKMLPTNGTFVAETLDPQDLQMNWNKSTQLFSFNDGWYAVFDYEQLGNNRGGWTIRWLRNHGESSAAESHVLRLTVHTWTPEEMAEALTTAGFLCQEVLDLWRGGPARSGTISQLIVGLAR